MVIFLYLRLFRCNKFVFIILLNIIPTFTPIGFRRRPDDVVGGIPPVSYFLVIGVGVHFYILIMIPL